MKGFIALEFVAGRTLRELLDDGPLLALLPHTGGQIARALSVRMPRASCTAT